jgi:hypothetical protein
MQQAVLWPILRELIVFTEKSIGSTYVLADVLANHHLATKGQEIVPAKHVVTADASFHDPFDGSQELRDENFQQRHSRSYEFGMLCLHVTKSMQATKHLDEQPPSLGRTSRHTLSNLGEYLNLVAVRRPDDTNKTRDLNCSMAPALSQPQPGGFAISCVTQTLSLEPTKHVRGHDVEAADASLDPTGRRSRKQIELVDSEAAHA